MAYSWQQRRPLSIPDHTLLAIRHMLFSSDERRTTDEEDGLFEHPAGVFSSCPRRAGHRNSAVPKWFFRSLLGASSPGGLRSILNRHPGRRASIEKKLRRTITQIADVFHIEGSQCYLTTSTEQELCCTTRVDTLPRRNRSMAPSPLAPITIRSAWCLEATFMILSARFPS